MTITITTIQSLRDTLKPQRTSKTIAFVPTMGNLHEGHVSLVKKAKTLADVVVVSIFVNPTQFGEGEDFDTYPRTFEADIEKLKNANADYVFVPKVSEIYPNFPQLLQTHMTLGDLTSHLCGHSRPTHFDGVGLVVSKLFNIVQPDIAVFGKKDYQQLALIRQLVDELNFPIEIVGGDIVRADDGLALSSRNQYLTDTQRNIAPQLNQLITELGQQLSNGEHLNTADGITHLTQATITKINATEFNVDYLNILNQQLTTPKITDKALVILVAAHLGSARLLDNVEIEITV